MFGVYLLGIIFIMLLIIDINVRVMSFKGKKINLHNTAYDALREMLFEHNINLKVDEI